MSYTMDKYYEIKHPNGVIEQRMKPEHARVANIYRYASEEHQLGTPNPKAVKKLISELRRRYEY